MNDTDPQGEAGQRKAPMLLITGFLGSGKTTLINRWLRLRDEEVRLGVLVNEFGQVGLDGALLGPGEILEMEGGCVCCATGRELWEAAESLLLRSPVTHLIVETSGIAEPQVLLAQYQELPAALKGRFSLLGLLCLVDALAVETALSRRAEAGHQIAAADRLLITKLDQCGGDRLAALHRLLDRQGATAERAALGLSARPDELRAVRGWALSGRPTRPVHPHEHHAGGQLCAVSLAEPAPLFLPAVRRLLLDMPGTLLRAKGVLWGIEEEGAEVLPWVVQLAGAQVELRPATPHEAQVVGTGVLVLIGEGLSEPFLRLRLSACRLVSE